MEFDWTNVGVALTSLVVGGGGVLLKFRRANSQERVDQADDKARVSMISRLEATIARIEAAHAAAIARIEAERDKAQAEAASERDERIEAQVSNARLMSDVEDMRRFVRQLLRKLPPAEREVYETDFAPMCILPPEKNP